MKIGAHEIKLKDECPRIILDVMRMYRETLNLQCFRMRW